MTTREDVIKAIEAVDERVHKLTPQLLTHVTAKLPVGEWRVRDALCHIAARSNGIPVAMAAAKRARAGGQGESAAARGVFEIDEVNRRQIDDRRARSLQQLLEEIHAGHQNELKAVRELDEQTLDEHMVFYAGGGEMSFAELLRRAGPGHENNHLDQIEKAIGG